MADRLLLTKCDLADAAQREMDALSRLRPINPRPRQIYIRGGEVSVASITAAVSTIPGKVPDVAGWLAEEKVREAAANPGSPHGRDRRRRA
jgi:G3E family GTPase